MGRCQGGFSADGCGVARQDDRAGKEAGLVRIEAAVREFARRQRIPLKNSYAYANGDEDVPLLDAVGYPHPVNPAPAVARHARDS